MASEDEDAFPDVDNLHKSFSDESDEDDDGEVPEWARSKSFDPMDNIRRAPGSGGSADNSELVAMEQKNEELQRVQRDINRKYCDRLKRRADLIAELRNAYLRDIVTLKHVINEQLSKDERVEVLSVWKKSIPSIDIRQHLMLYGPKEASFDVIPCETCGGSVELVHHDSSEIEELSKALSHMDKNKDDLRLIIATKGAQLENIQVKMEQQEASHNEEKRFLYKEMRSIKQKNEDLQSENVHLTNQVRGLRDHLSELRVKEERFDKVNSTLADTTALLHESNQNLKNMEDATSKSRETIAKLTEQLALCTQEKAAADADLVQQAAHIKSITNVSNKHKANSETLSKQCTKQEKMLDANRRENDTLSAKVQDLEMTLEQQNAEMTSEIESLESMLDTAREEAATLNEELREVHFNLTTKTNEKDHLQNSYNELHFAKEEAQTSYEQQIATLKMKAQKTEDELLRKTSNYDSMEADMNRFKEAAEKNAAAATELASMKKDFEKVKKDLDKMNEADKDRRRKVREAKKAEEEAEQKRLADLAARPAPKTPEEKRKKQKKESPKKTKDKARREKTQKAFEEKTEEVKGSPKVEQTKYVPHKRQRGKCRSSPLSTPSTSLGNEKSKDGKPEPEVPQNIIELDNAEAEVTSGLPPLAQGAEGVFQSPTSPSKTVLVPSPVSSRVATPKSGPPAIISHGSSRDIYTPGGFDYFNKLGVTGLVELSPALAFLVDAPQQMMFDLPDSLSEGNESEENSQLDLLVSGEGSMHKYDFGTHRDMKQKLQRACKKLVNEEQLAADAGVSEEFADSVLRGLAEIEVDDMESVGSVSSDVVVTQSQEENHSNEELNEYVGHNMDIMRTVSDDSFCSDINCEHHDLDTELHDETARIFGMTMKDTHYMLQAKMTVKESQKALDLMAPKLLEMSSITAKAQIGMWKAMRTTKLQTDLMCKFAATCQKMMPFLGTDTRDMDPDNMANLHQKLTDEEYFDKFREKWLSAVQDQLDVNLVHKLTEKEWNEQFSLFLDLESNSHFDYDEDREDSFDSALNTMFVLEGFTDKMSDGLERLMTGVFVDWAVNKLNILNFEGGGGGGGGGASEMELQRVYSEMNSVKNELDETKLNLEHVKADYEELKKRVEELEPEAQRANDLAERSGKLSNDLQALNTDFVNLSDEHKALIKSNTKLIADHKEANELIENQAAEIKSTKEAMARVQADLDYRNSIQQAMTDELEDAREKERIRLYGLVSSEMQTDPFIVDVGCQTEFIVPPMSLHHTMSSNIGRSTPASSKRSFYPVVTPAGPAKSFMASLHDEYKFPVELHSSSSVQTADFPDHASATSQMTSSVFDDGGTNMSSMMDGSDLLDERSVMTPILMHHESDLFSTGTRPGSKSSSKKGFNESLKMLNKLSAANQSTGKLNVGLPRIRPSESSDAGSQASGPQPLSGKLSPIKYVKPNEGTLWARSDTIRINPRSKSLRSESISDMLESHRQHQAPAYRKSMNSR